MKNKFFVLGLMVLLALGMASCPGSTPEEWNPGGDEVPNDPNLQSLRISGRNITFAGSGGGTPAQAVPIAVEFRSSETDESGVALNPPVLPLVVSIAAVDRYTTTIEYSVSKSETNPGTLSSTVPESLEHGEYFWIKVTAQGGAVLYYVIEATVVYDANALSVGNFTFTRNPTTRNYVVSNTIEPLTATVSVKGMYRYQWHTNTRFSNTGGTAIGEPVNQRADTFTYTPAVSAAGDYYYYLVVTNALGSKASSPAQVKINASALTPAANAFTISDTKYNYVRGIGGTGSFMFRTGSNADASPDADVTYIDKLFGEIGANNLRIMVQDDYLRYIENLVQSRNQAIFYHNAKKNFFAVIRRVNEYGGYVFANPWTAPAKMKTNGSTMGKFADWKTVEGATQEEGYLRPDSYIAYADHLRGFLKWLNDNNAPIFCLGILNEPDYGAGAAYEGMGLSDQQTINWFNLVGHFTTQEVIDKNANAANVTYRSDPIPGYGGGKATHHVLAMSGDSAGNVSNYQNAQLVQGSNTNNRQEVVGRHYYYSSGPRYTQFVGVAPTTGNNGNPGTTWEQRGTTGHGNLNPFSPDAYNMTTVLTQSPQMFPPESVAESVKREIWQTEHDINHGTSVQPTGTAWQYWNSAYAVLNWVDHTLRGCGESLSNWWFSSSFSGYVTSNHTLGWTRPYTITPRGRAVAHYARYVNETWLLGIERTRGTLTYNNSSSTFQGSSTVPKITAFEDIHGQYISVVMFAPGTPTDNAITGGFGNGGLNGINDPSVGSTNVGRLELILPDGYEAVSASAIRSWGQGTGQYWQDEPVFLSADGKSAEVTLPGGNVISVKFLLKDRPDPIPNDPRGRKVLDTSIF
jgi:hypothetical protein